MEAVIFGVPVRPSYMPKWITYRKNASTQETVEIYNIAIFICASINEGYELTGAEAMACGAALVSTDYESVHEYTENEKNALLSPVCDVERLVANAVRLIENDSLRISQSHNGVEAMQSHSWDNAMEIMNKLIEKCQE